MNAYARPYPRLLWQALGRALDGVRALFDRSAPRPWIPRRLRRRFTMDGRVTVAHDYRNDVLPANDPLVYATAHLEERLPLVAARKTFYYGQTDEWLYEALEAHSVRGKTVAVLGSESPLYECICLHYGAKPVTIEYRKIIVEDPRLRALTPAEYKKDPVLFDAILSISSFEHEGLGRYGDPLDPDADLAAMETARRMLKPGGLLFLSVPVGRDKLVWNSGRVYGRLRLPLLLQGWTRLASYGFDESTTERARAVPSVFVLQRSGDRAHG